MVIILVILALGLIIRSFIKGTFWSSSLSSGLGGAFIGIVIVGLLLFYEFMTAKRGEEVIVILYFALILIPAAAVIGAILFISIGALIRKKSSDISLSSKDSIPQSAIPEFPEETSQPDDSILNPISPGFGEEETYFDYKPGSRIERLAAFLTEKIIIIILLQAILGTDFYELDIRWEDGSFFTVPIIELGKFLGVSALLGAIFYPLWSGNAGHKLFGLKVISSVDGSDYNQADSGAVREFLKAVMSLICIPVVWLIWDTNRQNLYEKRVNTYVVKRHEAMSKRGVLLRGLLLGVMILLVIFQNQFYSVLHPGINKNIIGKWNGMSNYTKHIEFDEDGTVVNNGVLDSGYERLENYTYNINYMRYPFVITFIPISDSELSEIDLEFSTIILKAKFISETEILLFNYDTRITLTKDLDVRGFTDPMPERTNRFPSPANKISNDELKLFWNENIEALINLDINKIASQTSDSLIVDYGKLNRSFLFEHPYGGEAPINYKDSLDNIKENMLSNEMRAGLKDMNYNHINQIQLDNGEIVLMVYFLGEKYFNENEGKNNYSKYGLLFENLNGKWAIYSFLKSYGNGTKEEMREEQDAFVDRKLNQNFEY